MREDIPQKMIDDACESYLKHGGLQHEQIECEVRARGWRFHRNMLYRRSTSSGPRSAWPERYGWDAMLTPEQRVRLEQVRSRRAAGERAKFPGWLRAEFPEWKWAWPFQRHIYKRLASVTAGGNEAADDIYAAAAWQERDGDDQVYSMAAAERSEAERDLGQLQSTFSR
ncbi:MAG: hypothetical protein IPK01_03920 [Acidobacteria bacterium]|nr:hypothetical protein [Acidobacteriota bacterium]